MATILEALQNAKFNFNNPLPFVKGLAADQLNNAVTLLEKGYPIDTQVEPLLNEYDEVENVPEYDSVNSK